MSKAPSFDLTDKVAIVTGGAGIIGTTVCRALAAQGANVAVVDLDGPAADRTAAGIAADFPGRAFGLCCDVSDPASVAGMTTKIVERLGAIDVLHNNAATKGPDLGAFLEPFETYSLETWRHVMAVNIDGMFLVAQAVGNQMIRQGRGGSIIQTASIYGLVGPDFGIYEGSDYNGRPITTPAVYSASKAAVIGLSRYLATYWGPKGIRVNTLVPGGVESGQNDAFKDRYGARTPLGRMAERDEIAGAVIYLASDASRYVTGQTLAVDGGWTAM